MTSTASASSRLRLAFLSLVAVGTVGVFIGSFNDLYLLARVAGASVASGDGGLNDDGAFVDPTGSDPSSSADNPAQEITEAPDADPTTSTSTTASPPPMGPRTSIGNLGGPGAPLTLEAWTPVGDSTIGAGSVAGAFVVRFDGTWWGGARYDDAPGCDYLLSGWARNIDSDTYAFTVRTTIQDDDVAGRAFQYDPGASGYRDTEYPDTEGGIITEADTDNAWHRLDMAVLGSTYAVMVDGVQVAYGETSSTCGGIFLRLVRGSAEFLDMQVVPLYA
jgi:hypothetical protein